MTTMTGVFGIGVRKKSWANRWANGWANGWTGGWALPAGGVAPHSWFVVLSTCIFAYISIYYIYLYLYIYMCKYISKNTNSINMYL